MDKLIYVFLFLRLLLIIFKLFSPIYFNTYVNYVGNYALSPWECLAAYMYHVRCQSQ